MTNLNERQQKQVEEVREKIAIDLARWKNDICRMVENGSKTRADSPLGITDQILNSGLVAIVDDDQTAPCTELQENSPPNKGVITQDYLNGRLSILNANFRRIIPYQAAGNEVSDAKQ